MRIHLAYTALGLALVAGASAANAQTVVTPSGTLIAQEPPFTVPSGTIVAQPVTVQTVETVQTVRPARGARRVVRRRVVTTTRRTVVREAVIPTPAAFAARPLYDVVAPGPAAVVPTPDYHQWYYDGDYSRPLYDEVAPAPAAPFVAAMPVGDTVVTAPVVGQAAPYYRYVYQWDRILVIDPTTRLVVQTLPR